MDSKIHENIPWLDSASKEEMKRAVEAMYRVHKLIGAITNLDSLLEYITEESQAVAGAEASSIILYDADRDDLYFHIALGESGDQERLKNEVRLKLGQGIAGATAESRKSINVRNAQEDERFFRSADDTTSFQTRSLLAVPMIDHDQLVGVLEVLNKVDGAHFTALDMRVMEMFSGIAATAITNARLVEEKIKTERLAAIGQAVTGLSHYTKNIVSGLNSSSELIEMGLNQNNLEVLQKTWPIFKRSTRRITHFVQDMLSFSKPREPHREYFLLPDLLDEVVQSFRDIFHQKQIEVSLDTDELGGPVYAESTSLHRCLLNLVTNAADAVPDVDGCIIILARAHDDERIEILVEDNGPGIPPDILARIFDPFFSTKGAKGTGLGLAITQKIIHEHNGELLVEQSSLGGASFRILLPAKPPAPEKGPLQ
ncbi:MAG: ATP-binding protein [Candidatus Hydrogenedentes bacterium]|nr:ATP-binding protein [Candidatus Hydrogenedentota bacterium]